MITVLLARCSLGFRKEIKWRNLHYSFPSLSGTLAKHTKPTLQPNFVKEPSRPPTPTLGQNENAANLKDKMIENKKGQLVTMYISHWANDS